MNIDDFGELNALHKLLGKVKFQEDFDFYDFSEFAGSALIADTHKRVHEELWKEWIRRGYVEEGQVPEFRFDSPAGSAVKKRINELTEHEIKTLVKNQELDKYLEILITPYGASNEQLQLLRNYFQEKIKKGRHN